jgi:hypothetical protein
MLAGRLIRVITDILGEYSEFRIIEQLGAASTLSTQRAQLQIQQYTQQAQQLRQWAQTIIDQTKVGKYPDDIRKFLKDSNYSSALPESIARVVMYGFPDDKNLAISSSELGLYLQLANTLRSELGALVTAAHKFKIEEITIPPNEVSFDIIIPRGVFDERADGLFDILSRFTRIMSYFIELTTGSENSPTLTYTSTSDPVTGLAVFGAAAWAFLNFYKLILEVAEKQISLLKTVKEFRAFSPSGPADLEERVKLIMDGALKQAVDGAVASVPPKVPEERVNEVKIAINKDARVAVQVIANGVRIGITVESLDKIFLISEGVPDLTPEKVDEVLREQRALEHQVQQSLDSLGEPAPALLAVENSGTDKSAAPLSGHPPSLP